MHPIATLLILLWIACNPAGEQPAPLPPSAEFGNGLQLAVLEQEELSEISGMVHSSLYPGKFWIHNDSGDDPLLYLLDESGTIIRRFYLKGTAHLDWEDIAIAPAVTGKAGTLYIGDIGDNLAVRNYISIYKLIEPGPESPDTLTNITEFRFVYPDGARDAETLLCDPQTGLLYLLSKREARNRLYQIPLDSEDPGSVKSLIFLRELPVTISTAGDISPDGTEILIRNYFRAYYWYRPPATDFIRAFLSNPRLLNIQPEPQGEAIGWKYDQTGFYTLSERPGENPVILYFYPRK